MRMLRAASKLCLESQSLEALAGLRRDVFKCFHTSAAAAASATQTVLSSSSGASSEQAPPPAGVASPPRAPPPPPPPPPRRSWTLPAAAIAITASLGGVYYYNKVSDSEESQTTATSEKSEAERKSSSAHACYPSSAAEFPSHVEYLIAGGGAAAAAALRTLRASKPSARVLLVDSGSSPPYMRPPLSKEMWRGQALADLADEDVPLEQLGFTQWNGKKRRLVFEPVAFYTPVEELSGSAGGAGAARGWLVTRLDVANRTAEINAPGHDTVTVTYDACLIATGSRPILSPVLAEARAAGLSFPLGAVEAARGAARVLRARAARGGLAVAVCGHSPRAPELAATLAQELGPSSRVILVCPEERPLASILPTFLCSAAAEALREAGVRVRCGARVEGAAPREGGLRLLLMQGEELLEEDVDLVIEAWGTTPETSLAKASGLEVGPDGVILSAELAALGSVWAAGDVANWYSLREGGRVHAHTHDHAVASGRRAAENMARPPHLWTAYTHEPMTWSELGSRVGFEAIGRTDPNLQTVSVFSSETDTAAPAAAAAPGGSPAALAAPPAAPAADGDLKYSRGVVFYTDQDVIVGVLLWNLYNRLHVARRALRARLSTLPSGSGDRREHLLELGKLFTLHQVEED